MADEEKRPIIIKKIKKVAGGHHGGAWKVAYADFVTAMMAFFMMLWLLNISDKETLEGLADYFTPTTASTSSSSGSGAVLGGTSLSTDGAQSSGAVAVDINAPPPTEASQDEDAEAAEAFESKINERENAMFEDAADRIRQAVQQSPELTQHEDQILIEQTPDGMRIQIIDKDRRSMFQEGTADMYGYATRLIEEVGTVVEKMPNRVAIMGHTDASTLRGEANYTNWELSADRANAARRVLRASGVSTDRFSEATGKAATEPLFPDSPFRPENRRITILVLREAPVLAPGARPGQ